jgi:hypothetical protein
MVVSGCRRKLQPDSTGRACGNATHEPALLFRTKFWDFSKRLPTGLLRIANRPAASASRIDRLLGDRATSDLEPIEDRAVGMPKRMLRA